MRLSWLAFLGCVLLGARLAESGKGVTGGACYFDDDSSTCPRSTTCVAHDDNSGDGTCQHKALFPLNSMDVLGSVLTMLSSALAAGGGVGGGGLLVPIFLLVFDFEAAQATALSLATIAGSSLANLYLNAPRSHPNPTLRRSVPPLTNCAGAYYCAGRLPLHIRRVAQTH